MDAFTLVARLTLNKEEFDASFKSIETDINSDSKKSTFSAWGVAVGNLAARAFSKAFSAASGFAKSIIMTGMDFDSMMSEVKAVGKMTEEQFNDVRQRAIDLGASTKFTAKEVGEAFYYMGLAGWDSEEMLAGISGVLDLAAASGENLGTVSDIVTDAITAMGLTASDTAEFVNVLAAASTNSNTTVAMMGEAFKYLATTGGTLGYTIQDVATVLGLLANNGIKASQAGTSMRQILNTLVAPSDKARAAMDALGVSLFEAGTDKRKPLLQVVEELRTIFKDANFNLEGFSAADMQEGLEKIDEWYDKEEKKIQQDYDSGAIGKKVFDYQMKQLDAAYKEKFSQTYGPNEWFLGKLSNIGGLRGISSLFALMNSTDDDVNQLVDAVNKSSEGNGAAKDMAETMIDNLEGDITLMNSALDGLKILMSDEYKGALRGFVQVFTQEIGNLSKAFDEGGISGMLINLTDWIINGITDTLSNPDITVEGANKFGKALGDFVGHLVSTLVTSAPELISGLFTAGMNLAGGLVEGLFAGLFGTGEGSVAGFITGVHEEEQDAIKEANKTATQAQGIVNYMDSLVTKYGDAAKNTNEWKTALSELEELMPGITEQVNLQSDSVKGITENLSTYIETSKQQAIEQAKQKALGDIQQKALDAEVNLALAETYADIYKGQQEEAVRKLAEYIVKAEEQAMQRELQELDSWNLSPEDYEKQKAWILEDYKDRTTVDDIVNEFRNGRLNMNGLMFEAERSAEQLGENQDYIESLKKAYDEATREYNNNSGKIKGLTEDAQLLQTQLQIAQAAAARMSEKMDSFEVPSLTTTDPGEHAAGNWFVPYNDYPALLHRGEAVLTASQARQFRENASGAKIDISALTSAIVGAVQEGLRDAQVNAYLDGNRVTREVSRIMNDQMMLAR